MGGPAGVHGVAGADQSCWGGGQAFPWQATQPPTCFYPGGMARCAVLLEALLRFSLEVHHVLCHVWMSLLQRLHILLCFL